MLSLFLQRSLARSLLQNTKLRCEWVVVSPGIYFSTQSRPKAWNQLQMPREATRDFPIFFRSPPLCHTFLYEFLFAVLKKKKRSALFKLVEG